MADFQDWKDVTISKKRPTSAATSKNPKNVTAAQRAGLQVEAVKKYNAGGNARGGTDKNALKLDLETEELSHATVSTDVKKAIQQGRIAKKLTQAQLAQQINEKPQIIQEYETGKAIPNQQILAKLERILGVKLRGKKK